MQSQATLLYREEKFIIKAKVLSALVILTMMLGLLAACGDSPTATPVPTATPDPPTATAVPEPTNTAETLAPATAETTTGTGGTGSTSGPAANAADIALIQAGGDGDPGIQELSLHHAGHRRCHHRSRSNWKAISSRPISSMSKGTAEGKTIEEVVSGGKVYRKKDASGKWVEAQPVPTATPEAAPSGDLGGG